MRKRNPALWRAERTRISGLVSRGLLDCMLRRTPGDDAQEADPFPFVSGSVSRSTKYLVYRRKLPLVARLIAVEDLLDATAVASLLGLKHRNSVATYLHRYPDFPRPVFDTGSGRCRLWSRSEVEEWLRTRTKDHRVRRH